jgi:hypothetical protein
MRRSTEAGLAAGMAIGGIIKTLVMIIASFAIIGWAIYLATQGEWVGAAIFVFIIEPIALFVLDIMTGVVMALLVGIRGALGALFGLRSRDEYRPDWEA